MCRFRPECLAPQAWPRPAGLPVSGRIWNNRPSSTPQGSALPPRSLPSDPSKKRNCPSCRLIRLFLLVAAFLLIALWTQPELLLPKGIDLGKLVGDLVAVLFVLLLGWQIWRYVRERRNGEHDDGLTWTGHPRRPPPRTPEELAALAERARQQQAAASASRHDEAR